MIEGINSVPKSKEVPSQENTDKEERRPPNAYEDWKKVKTWSEEILQQCHSGNNNQITEQQKSINSEKRTKKWDTISKCVERRVERAKGFDCIKKRENFQEFFFKWEEKFFEDNKGKAEPTTTFISVIETDLLQRNLAMYQNGDHSPERVKILLFYFRKQAGRNFLKQVVPSALYPKEWLWTTEEVNSIKEQLDEQFSACIKALEEPLRLSILKEHRQLQTSRYDTLWWLADACLQDFLKDDSISDLLNKIIYYCYDISQDNSSKKMQADQTFWKTYKNYNPLAGNFLSIYKSNFHKMILDDICITDNEKKRKRIESELKDKYEGKKLKEEIEKQFEKEKNISIDAPICNDNANGDTIGSLLQDDGFSPEEETSVSQTAIFWLRAFADTVNSRKHLIRCNDDLFFTETVSRMIREDKQLAKHVYQNEKLYTKTCNMDFLNSYLQQSVTNISESRKCPLKKIQDFHPEEQNPKYARECGFPLENIVYRQFLHVKNDSNITEKRKTFQKHMQDCLNNQGLT